MRFIANYPLTRRRVEWIESTDRQSIMEYVKGVGNIPLQHMRIKI